jgi:actin, other eukaryote
MKAAQE